MKKIILTSLLMLSASLANAWTCEARSNSAYGIGVHYDLNIAGQIAMNQCVAFTPQWDMCVIIRCFNEADLQQSQ